MFLFLLNGLKEDMTWSGKLYMGVSFSVDVEGNDLIENVREMRLSPIKFVFFTNSIFSNIF